MFKKIKCNTYNEITQKQETKYRYINVDNIVSVESIKSNGYATLIVTTKEPLFCKYNITQVLKKLEDKDGK